MGAAPQRSAAGLGRQAPRHPQGDAGGTWGVAAFHGCRYLARAQCPAFGHDAGARRAGRPLHNGLDSGTAFLLGPRVDADGLPGREHALPAAQGQRSASAVAVANGQYILIRRRVYDLVGGYARPDLRATLLDDRDLAHVVKATGFRLRFVDGRGLLRVHMYHGLNDIWRGWRKNAFLGNRGGVPFLLLQLLGLPLIAVIPFLLPLLTGLPRERSNINARAIGGSEAALAAALEIAPLLAYRTWLNLRLGMGARRGFLYALTHPLAALMFDGILAQSMWRVLTGKGVDWRGRQYRRAQRGDTADLARQKQAMFHET